MLNIKKKFGRLFSLKNHLIKYILLWNQFYYDMTSKIPSHIFFCLVSKNFSNYGKRHLKLIINWHVSWDTLYIVLDSHNSVLARLIWGSMQLIY